MRHNTPHILALSLLTLALAACNKDRDDEHAATPAPSDEYATAPAPAEPAPVTEPTPATGPSTYTIDRFDVAGEGDAAYLTDSKGRRLYVLEGDKGGTKCVGDCLKTFHAVVGPIPTIEREEISAASLGTITRSDGTTQVTYYGQPLYYYDDGTPQLPDVMVVANQTEPGQWYLVRPNGQTLPLKEGVPTTVSPTAAGADARELPTQSPGGQPGEVKD
jgi:predicted lipoprotein with Yx(FWY)xxD motif